MQHLFPHTNNLSCVITKSLLLFFYYVFKMLIVSSNVVGILRQYYTIFIFANDKKLVLNHIQFVRVQIY